MAGVSQESEDKREAFLEAIFATLDQKRRGFISRLELGHILTAMKAEAFRRFAVPEELALRIGAKDSRVSMSELRNLLRSFSQSDLEDVKWFTENVLKVESELRDDWRGALQRWRGSVERLHSRNLHRYVIASQPEHVARWLLLRIPSVEKTEDVLPGPGVTQSEVEALFADEVPEEVERCTEELAPFLIALDVFGELVEASASCELAEPRIVELLSKLTALAQPSREVACLLVHEGTLSTVTRMLCNPSCTSKIMLEGSQLLVALIDHRVHETARDYEWTCRGLIVSYLEIGFEAGAGLDLEAERLALGTLAGQEFHGKPKRPSPATVSEWVGRLITIPQDADRGEMVDWLIKFDEKRVLLESAGGQRAGETAPVPVSLLSFGRVVPFLLIRLDVSSHYTLHEHRTPIRTLLWKLLLNVLASGGDRGRIFFRAGEGVRVICSSIRGNEWGSERGEVAMAEEENLQEEAELATLDDDLGKAAGEWPGVEHFVLGQQGHQFYSRDYLDDEFYGSKDRVLAAAFLEYASTLWGDEVLAEEMMQYPNTLQVLCRARQPSCFLIRLLLDASGFPEYLLRVAQLIAEVRVDRSLQRLGGPASRSCLVAMRTDLVTAEQQDAANRIIAYAYHHLQARLHHRRAADDAAEAGSLQAEEVEHCCRLLAARLPLKPAEVSSVAVSIWLQLKHLIQKALLAANPLQQEEPTSGTSSLRAGKKLRFLREVAGRLSSGVSTQPLDVDALPPPPDFLSGLCLLRLVALQDGAVSRFTADLQSSLELLTGWQKTGSVAADGMQVAPPGSDCLWYGGQAPLEAFPVACVPLRRVDLQRFPRGSPLDVLNGLQSVITEYGASDTWKVQSESDGGEVSARRRDSLRALVFKHLCYFHPRTVTMEASPQGLMERLGISLEMLGAVREWLTQPPCAGLHAGVEFVTALEAAPREAQHCRAFRCTPDSAVVGLELGGGLNRLAFVCMSNTWMLWANCSNDPALTLTNCNGVNGLRKYFAYPPDNRG